MHVLVCAMGFFVLIAACAQDTARGPTPAPTAVTTPTASPAPRPSSLPLHWKMTMVHASRGGEGPIPVDEETMLSERFGLLLDKMAHKCRNTELNIANMTVESHNRLLEAGIDIPLLDLMEKYNANVSAACGASGYGDAPSGSYRQQQKEYAEAHGEALDVCALVYASTTLFFTDEDIRITSEEYQSTRDELARFFEDPPSSVDEALIGL